jgi:hypothetical protein
VVCRRGDGGRRRVVHPLACGRWVLRPLDQSDLPLGPPAAAANPHTPTTAATAFTVSQVAAAVPAQVWGRLAPRALLLLLLLLLCG